MPSHSLRIFAAIVPEPPLTQALLDLQHQLKGSLSRARFTAPEQLHLTLAFHPRCPEPHLAQIITGLRQECAKSRPLAVVLRPPGAFPSPSRARTLWSGVAERDIAGSSGELFRLAEAIQGRWREEQPENERELPQPFVPHITLARLKGISNVEAALSAAWDTAMAVQMEIRELVLFRSELCAGGAKHTPLHRVRLDPVRLGGAA